MKVLITGSSGLVGKNITEALTAENFELILPSHAEVDLLDFTSVKKYFVENSPDMIIHCAGRVGGIQANIKEPIKFLVDNLDMGRNVIMAAYSSGIKKLLNFGSSCMYPRDAPNPLKEEFILQGELEPTNEGYALAKITAQRLCSYIMKEDPEYQYKTLLPCNLYGKHDKFDLAHAHMIPSAINKIHTAKLNNTSVQVWGTGLARREFMYAGDLADSVLFSINNFHILPEVVNIGTGKDFSINEYYASIAEVIGYNGIFVHDKSKPEGMKQKLVSIELLNSLGWHAKTSLHDGIEKTYNYYIELLRTRK